jgi:peptidoglycan/xylan/chitin deacetylase (PgdA/CDA1 family)
MRLREVPILVYHRITKQVTKDGVSISFDKFKAQMNYLRMHNYKVINLSFLIKSINNRKNLPKKSVVLTFDDGYVDFYEYAYPVLKDFGFTASIFLVSSYIGRYADWNEKVLLLDKQQIQELIKQGFCFYSHTKSHKMLPLLNNKEKYNQIYDSKKELEDILQRKVDYIAYPYGEYDESTIEVVKSCGYLAGFATDKGNKEIYSLYRIVIFQTTSRISFLKKISGFYRYYKKFCRALALNI